MKLLGITTEAQPYVPLCERESEQPTVFWLKPKTVGMVQSVNRTTDDLDLPGGAEILFEKREIEFLSLCEKVQNYEFSDGYPDLNKLGVIKKIADKKILQLLLKDINPDIFVEVMQEIDSWSTLKANQRKLFELMTFFALHKNEEMPLQERLSYNCDTCQLMEKFKERHCFYLNPTNMITMPKLGDQDDFTGIYDILPDDIKEYTPETFLEEFFEINIKHQPTTPAFIALSRLQNYMNWDKEVCITGLVSEEYIKVLNWAIDCKAMGSMPFPGSYFEQPNQLIEAFGIVNNTMSEYDRIRIEKMSQNTKGKK